MPSPKTPLNHLATERSLYLQQHAGNPLDWHPWGESAFELARREQRPILLSIGYSSCYWCHVMEDEVFSQEDVAEFMNARYICIKVDREERPDVDAAYMQAAQLLTGAGGWPLNVWLAPDLKPVYAGTYFPKADFLNVSAQIAHAWATDRAQFESVGSELVAAVNAGSRQAKPGAVSRELLDSAARSIMAHCDTQWGGLASRVKFPEPVLWEFLLHYYTRTKDEQARTLLTLTLDRMHDGGLYDHIGGGWHRYSTDRTWLVPHFEKMLYDNAQLAALYAYASRVLEEPRYAAIARGTLDFMLREMPARKGGFAASLDASSGGVEGSYYVWTPEDLAEVAGDDAPELARVLGIAQAPNFQDHHGKVSGSVITRRADDPQGLFAKYRPALQAKRSEREAPARDDKVVTAWNALASLAGAPSRAIGYIMDSHGLADGALFRASNQGLPSSPGVLEDYALLALAQLGLHAQNPYSRHLQLALKLIEYVEMHFATPDGGYFQTPQTAEMPFERRVNTADTVEPSGNSVMARVLLKASLLTGNLEYREHAGGLLNHFAGSIAGSPLESAHWLTVCELYLGPYNLVVIASDEPDEVDRLIHDLRGTAPILNYEIVRLNEHGLEGQPADLRALQPVLEGKHSVASDRPTVYVCTHGACHAPVHSAPEARELLLGQQGL